MATDEVQMIIRDARLVTHPSQREYARTLVNEFLELHEMFPGPQPVKLLFSIDESDTFDVTDVVQGLPQDPNVARTAPQPLLMEFVKAGFPIPQDHRIIRDGAMPGAAEWEISSVLPGDELNAYTGRGVILTSANQVTLGGFDLEAAPSGNQVNGYMLRVNNGPRAGLAGTIEGYTAATRSVTLGSDWQALPGPSSQFAIDLEDLAGTGVTIPDMANPLSVKVRLPDNVTIAENSLSGGTLTITDGPGAGLQGKIAENDTAGVLIMDASSWQPLPGATDTFEIVKETTYTVRLVPDDLDVLSGVSPRLEVYADSDDPELLVEWRIAQIDALISRQLSLVMHNPDFQKLEATWRGLHDLVFNTHTGTQLKLRLLNATRLELQSDLEDAVEFDQSVLFKKIYEEEYGTFGGSPYSALLADFEFGRLPQDVNFLVGLSNVAAAAHAPLITNAAPGLFDLQSYADLEKPRDLAKIFESAELIKWNAFRNSEDSRYVTLALPHVLSRLPYGPRTVPITEFNFAEQVTGHDDFLWGNAAWVLAQRITEAFFLYSWTAAIRGYEGGGLVGGLPIYTYKTDHGDIAVEVPTEVAITDRREKELSDLGFIALCYRKGTDEATFFGGQTANRPKVYIQDAATANARLSASLPYLLASSRFAHFIKVMMRDKIGSFMTRQDVSNFLNRWIVQYVLLDDNASALLKARYPLREGRIDVTDDPARPGCYNAVVFLRPHFQLEELTVSMRLVASLPAPVGK